MEPDFVSDTVKSLRELNELGKPRTDEELEKELMISFCSARKQEYVPGNREFMFMHCIFLELLYLNGMQASIAIIEESS